MTGESGPLIAYSLGVATGFGWTVGSTPIGKPGYLTARSQHAR